MAEEPGSLSGGSAGEPEPTSPEEPMETLTVSLTKKKGETGRKTAVLNIFNCKFVRELFQRNVQNMHKMFIELI